MFIVFGGLPGSGKSTIAQVLAKHLEAVYLRIDTIEQTIRSSGILAEDGEVGPAGYMIAYRLAEEHLRLGHVVIADSVNSISITRDAYRAIAENLGVPCLEVEVVCSDPVEHRRRVESRISEVPGLKLPSWQQVVERDYEVWDRSRLVIDTAVLPVSQAVEHIIAAVSRNDMKIVNCRG